MATKKQSEMLKIAIELIRAHKTSTKEFQNLWEDNENNSNALLIGLMNYIEGRPEFCRDIKHEGLYVPEKLLKYAGLYDGINPLMQKLIESVEVLSTDLENTLNQIDDINRFNYEVTPEKWEHLTRYYFEPLAASHEKVSEAYCDLDI